MLFWIMDPVINNALPGYMEGAKPVVTRPNFLLALLVVLLSLVCSNSTIHAGSLLVQQQMQLSSRLIMYFLHVCTVRSHRSVHAPNAYML
jgi:hypothetical protein